MNNFFYSSSDYDSFRKALKDTKNEPVIINILSSDSSLAENSESNKINAERKNISSKFQASPFDKFFGPRKKRTDPLDMKDFSSWRNKNFRESEKQIESDSEETTKFSFSDYLKSRTKNEMFNDEDKLKSELQKPIDEMSINDESYKKFSLDSYLNKLERETKVKKDFNETEDLVDDTIDFGMTPSEDQDENFGTSSDVDVERVAFDDVLSGEKFAFEREDLDKVKSRLEKMEREANNIKEKPTTKVLTGEELTEAKGADEENDEFDLDKLGFEDDIERVNQKLDEINKKLQVTGDGETSAPVVEKNKFVEINKNFDETKVRSDSASVSSVETSTSNQTDSSEANINETETNGEVNQEETEEGVVSKTIIAGAVASPDEVEGEDETAEGSNFVDVVSMPDESAAKETETEVDADVVGIKETDGEASSEQKEESSENVGGEVLTKADFKHMTDEIINKFSEMYRGTSNPEALATEQVGEMNGYAAPGEYVFTGQGQERLTRQQMAEQQAMQQQMMQQQMADQQQMVDQQAMQQQQNELQAKIIELIEKNKKNDDEVAEKLKLIEEEKQKISEQYEEKLKELEESIKKQEEARQQAYVDKLKSDIKFKTAEARFKLKEEQIKETEKLNSENQYASKRLRSELKNNLQVANLEMDKKLLECVTKLSKASKAKVDEDTQQEELNEVEEKPTRTRTAAAKSTKKRTPSTKARTRQRTPRRKMDSDIIGSIDFE